MIRKIKLQTIAVAVSAIRRLQNDCPDSPEIHHCYGRAASELLEAARRLQDLPDESSG